MAIHLYLSLIPEALVFSELPPERFGKYLAIGSKRLTSGPAIFFELDPELSSDAFQLDAARKKCKPHPDGTARASCYAAIYMVLARIPIEKLGKLYLTTEDGLTLQLDRSDQDPPKTQGLHLYQELAPVQPRVASPLGPKEFVSYVTNPANPIFLPRLAFCELRLGDIATNPEESQARDLPYRNLSHLRECLVSLKYNTQKMTKIVTRDMDTSRLFPVLENGIFVGDQEHFAYYPLPNESDLENKHFRWFNSASKTRRL